MGAVLWAIGVTLIGYYLGSIIPGIDRYLWPIIILIILISLLPTFVHIAKDKNFRQQLFLSIKNHFSYKNKDI